MKTIKYALCTTVNRGKDEAPVWDQIFSPVEMGWNEANEEIARREAYNGEYAIEEIPDEEPPIPTQLDIIEAQVVYTAMMTNTLLEV